MDPVDRPPKRLVRLLSTSTTLLFDSSPTGKNFLTALFFCCVVRSTGTPAETIAGGSSVINFSKCINFEQVTMLIPDYDTNNFGLLDKFEACVRHFVEQRSNRHIALTIPYSPLHPLANICRLTRTTPPITVDTPLWGACKFW